MAVLNALWRFRGKSAADSLGAFVTLRLPKKKPKTISFTNSFTFKSLIHRNLNRRISY
jgi:hypothetical protein